MRINPSLKSFGIAVDSVKWVGQRLSTLLTVRPVLPHPPDGSAAVDRVATGSLYLDTATVVTFVSPTDQITCCRDSFHWIDLESVATVGRRSLRCRSSLWGLPAKASTEGSTTRRGFPWRTPSGRFGPGRFGIFWSPPGGSIHMTPNGLPCRQSEVTSSRRSLFQGSNPAWFGVNWAVGSG